MFCTPEPPEEYTTAHTNLLNFRGKVLTDLVGGRVIAGLDAGHASMLKYKNLIDGLGVTPYLFGRVQEYALALKFKGIDVDTGGIRRVKGEYVGGTADYPLQPPYQVPRRPLPQVDVFSYTPVTDLDMLDKANAGSLRSFVLIRCPSGTFRETPDAENAIYDYYELYPTSRYGKKWHIVNPNPSISDWDSFEGEEVKLDRALVKAGTYDNYEYYVSLWFDCLALGMGAIKQSNLILVRCDKSSGAFDIHFSIAGQTVSSAYHNLYGTWKWTDREVGFANLAENITVEVPYEPTWLNHFDVIISVNDVIMGTTNPIPDTYTHPAYTDLIVTAYPNVGYKFKHWERDATIVSVTNPYTLRMLKDYTLKAVFEPL